MKLYNNVPTGNHGVQRYVIQKGRPGCTGGEQDRHDQYVRKENSLSIKTTHVAKIIKRPSQTIINVTKTEN